VITFSHLIPESLCKFVELARLDDLHSFFQPSISQFVLKECFPFAKSTANNEVVSLNQGE
jgi:hypothetical protein